MADSSEMRFYPTSGSGAFTYGIAYTTNGTTLCVYDGTLDSADIAGWATVEKVSAGTLAAGAVTAFPADLKLTVGTVTLEDGEARPHTVAGTLAFAGGANLVLDVLPGGNDAIEASAIDLSGVSAENPVTLTLVPKGAGIFSETGALVLLSGGLAAGEEAKFRVEGLAAALSVSNGSLVATLPDDVPYTAEWVGQGDRTNLADQANWRCLDFAGRELTGKLPTAASAIVVGANTTFCFPRGQTLDRRELIFADEVTLAADCDWRGLQQPIDSKINLHGHKLYLSSLDGRGAITDDATGYQLLEFVESSGSQYIDTGYTHAANVRIECEVSVTPAGTYSYSAVFGSRAGGYANTDNALGFFVRWNKANRPVLEYGPAGRSGGNVECTDNSFPNYERVKIVFENKTVSWTGVTKSGSITSNLSSTPAGLNPMLIFDTNGGAAGAVKNDANLATMRLYSFKALENGEVKCHLVPARRRSDGTVGVLDLANGNTFHAGLGTGTLAPGPVVAAESAFAAGELHLDVPSGEIVANTTVALTGSLKLVKEGEGTFTPLVDNQTYFGGTDLREGWLTVNAHGTNRRFGAAGSEIRIKTGATMDMAGYYDFDDYGFVLAGGTLKNSTALASHWTKAMISTVRVTEEQSRLDFNKYGVIDNSYHPTLLDLQGHRLDADFEGLSYVANTLATKGTLAIHGQVEFYKGNFMGPETTLDMYGELRLNGVDVHVGTYIARSSTNACAYNGDLYVYERFMPVTDNFWGCVLKDGAVLDLSMREDVWNTTGALVSSEATFTKKTVTFEDKAVICVDVGEERRLRNGQQIVAWPVGSKPNAKFRPASGMDCDFVAKDDGLYVVKGLTVIIR